MRFAGNRVKTFCNVKGNPLVLRLREFEILKIFYPTKGWNCIVK